MIEKENNMSWQMETKTVNPSFWGGGQQTKSRGDSLFLLKKRASMVSFRVKKRNPSRLAYLVAKFTMSLLSLLQK